MSVFVALAFPLSLIAAAVSDLIRYEIPNGVPIVLLAGYAGYAVVADFSLFTFGSGLSAGVAVLAGGAILFRLGLLGGGDAKLLAAATPWFGWSGLPWFLLLVALWGGVLAVAVFVVRRLAKGTSRAGPVWWQRLCRREGGIPYGVAICGGGLSLFGNILTRDWVGLTRDWVG